MERLSAEEFERIRNCYTRLNDSFPETLIFRVGSSSGFYSEACSMMECMMFCYLNNIRFSLYSADANFSKVGRGWREFFDSFCPENHQHWNQSFNHRHSPPALRQMIKDSLSGKMGLSDQVRNWLSLAGRHLLLKKEGAKYLTSDFFKIFTSAHFKSSPIHWPLFSMDGSVYPEIAKLFPYAMRHNQETHEEITQIRNSLGLPNSYASVQMRGGDKIAKLERRGDVADAKTLSAAHSYIRELDESGIQISDIFVLTDDYSYISALEKAHPEWTIYTLARPDHNGYNQKQFNAMDWKQKRLDLVRLFAAVEICRDSTIHFGHEMSNVNTVIKTGRPSNSYKKIFHHHGN